NGKLYGFTDMGGDNDLGVIFSINPDGSGFQLLHEFNEDNGEEPFGTLTVYNDKLYGMTSGGGTFDKGVVFSIDSDGSNFYDFYHITGGPGGGQFGGYGVVVDNDVVYGVTYMGGASQEGVVFSVTITGNDFQMLHEFDINDGSRPQAKLTLIDNILYGMTTEGGASNLGVIFSITTTGGDFTLLYEFSGSADDGGDPRGELTIFGNTLYGTTAYGGDYGYNGGTVFSITTSGTDFTLLHEFSGSVDDGKWPLGSLTFSDGKIYGMTYEGGDNTLGVIFSMDIDGTNYTNLHEFAGGVNDGQYPEQSNQVVVGTTLYGMTWGGGDNDLGVIFKYDFSPPIPEPTTIILLLLSFLGLIGKHVKRKHSS
ncbi:choice-of-anchor tandem repeat GloVer-containing protein, partial [Chlamydiota bacterium]